MSNLISGKEALIALANGEEVEFREVVKDRWLWMNAKILTTENILNHTATYTTHKSPSEVEVNSYSIQFRLKPRTITINGIEVPRNKSKHNKDDVVWVINTSCESWYDWIYGSGCDSNTLYWESEEEIKQVVAALRAIFKEAK